MRTALRPQIPYNYTDCRSEYLQNIECGRARTKVKLNLEQTLGVRAITNTHS